MHKNTLVESHQVFLQITVEEERNAQDEKSTLEEGPALKECHVGFKDSYTNTLVAT